MSQHLALQADQTKTAVVSTIGEPKQNICRPKLNKYKQTKSTLGEPTLNKYKQTKHRLYPKT